MKADGKFRYYNEFQIFELYRKTKGLLKKCHYYKYELLWHHIAGNVINFYQFK